MATKEQKNELEKALAWYLGSATEEEIKEQLNWYKTDDIDRLFNIMYESYLNNYDGEELDDRIKLLREE